MGVNGFRKLKGKVKGDFYLELDGKGVVSDRLGVPGFLR